MNGKTLRVIALGLGGLVLALVLVVGAFALAGQQIAQPAGVPVFTTSMTPSPTPGDDGTASTSPEHERTDSPSPSVDDHGGNTGESTSGGSSGSDDGGGSGGHDSSGSGSDNSGSGSDDSSGSGSGSGEHGDD
jgi:hypothetical protein